MSADTLKTKKKVIGAKQTAKALEKGTASLVYFAKDADKRVIAPLQELCLQKKIPVEIAPSMSELGKLCGIEVGAAAVALLK